MVKKILCLVIAIMLMLTCVGCNSVESVELYSSSMFTKIEKVWMDGYFFNVVYHQQTKVMYTVSYEGIITVMLNADGKPLLWEG